MLVQLLRLKFALSQAFTFMDNEETQFSESEFLKTWVWLQYIVECTLSSYSTSSFLNEFMMKEHLITVRNTSFIPLYCGTI